MIRLTVAALALILGLAAAVQAGTCTAQPTTCCVDGSDCRPPCPTGCTLGVNQSGLRCDSRPLSTTYECDQAQEQQPDGGSTGGSTGKKTPGGTDDLSALTLAALLAAWFGYGRLRFRNA